ncbi:TolC family protein [bacterium]|nr:TolC family protein [bacterium]
MYKSILIVAICSTIAIAQTHLTFDEGYKRKMSLDAGNRAFKNQRTALMLSSDIVHALPSTELETVVENFGQDEIEISAKQVFESRRVRKNRQSLIGADIKALDLEATRYKRQIHFRLSTYFLEIINVNSQVQFSTERLEVTNKMFDWQNLQFKEGALAESELIRTRFSIADIESKLVYYQAIQSSLTSELSSYLDTVLYIENLPSAFPDFPEYAVINDSWSHLDSAPTLQYQQAVIRSLEAERQASDLPLITSMSFTAGMKLIPEFNQKFPVVGISLESPLFTRRSTMKKIKKYELDAGIDELERVTKELSIKKEAWLNKWSTDGMQLQLLETSLIPKATELYDRINNEYRAGSRPYLEVLDAQGLLTDLQERALSLRVEQAAKLLELNVILGETVYEFN